jgi:hypothetical protein
MMDNVGDTAELPPLSRGRRGVGMKRFTPLDRFRKRM